MGLFWFVMLLMAGWQVPRLLREKQNKELAAFIGIWLVSGVYGSLVIAEIELVSPLEIIINIVETIY